MSSGPLARRRKAACTWIHSAMPALRTTHNGLLQLQASQGNTFHFTGKAEKNTTAVRHLPRLPPATHALKNARLLGKAKTVATRRYAQEEFAKGADSAEDRKPAEPRWGSSSAAASRVPPWLPRSRGRESLQPPLPGFSHGCCVPHPGTGASPVGAVSHAPSLELLPWVLCPTPGHQGFSCRCCVPRPITGASPTGVVSHTPAPGLLPWVLCPTAGHRGCHTAPSPPGAPTATRGAENRVRALPLNSWRWSPRCPSSGTAISFVSCEDGKGRGGEKTPLAFVLNSDQLLTSMVPLPRFLQFLPLQSTLLGPQLLILICQ